MLNSPYPLLFAFGLLPFGIRAQTASGGNAAVDLLTGGGSQAWTIVGAQAATGSGCAAGDVMYTFKRTPAEVVVQECKQGAWSSRTVPYTTWAEKGKEGIVYGGVTYEVKELRSSAPVCKGNNTCIRLSSMPDGTSDAARLIYLTH